SATCAWAASPARPTPLRDRERSARELVLAGVEHLSIRVDAEDVPLQHGARGHHPAMPGHDAFAAAPLELEPKIGRVLDLERDDRGLAVLEALAHQGLAVDDHTDSLEGLVGVVDEDEIVPRPTIRDFRPLLPAEPDGQRHEHDNEEPF